jgi:ornithine--oxo-acid transaminase
METRVDAFLGATAAGRAAGRGILGAVERPLRPRRTLITETEMTTAEIGARTGRQATTGECIALEERYGAHNYHPLDVVVERASGVWVWDVEGRRYMDFLASYSAVNQGHCHPAIVAALVEQAHKVTLTSRAFRNDQLGLFYRDLCELTGFSKVLPMNTGAEAVETAIKAARKWAYTRKGVAEDRAEILVFEHNFHGRTTTIVGFSSEEQYRRGFGPFTPGFRMLPYGDAAAVERAITPETAAVLVEPIQGEGGIIVPPDGYLARLRELTRRHGVLLMVDEIQSGLGRTGKLFAYEHEGIRPDVVIVGKALSGGLYPVSAVLSDEEVMAVFQPGDHGSTYGGNPLGAAVARAALRALVDEDMVGNSARLGAVMMERLRSIASPHVREVRGKGLWIGIELHPAAGGARRFCEALQDEGLLCKETHEHVIRIAPPLVIGEDEVEWALARLEKVLTTL